MAGEIEITLHQEFAQELKSLADMLRAWDKSCLDQIIKALKVIGQRWKAECVKRVPVDTGNLKNRILTETYKEAGGDWTTAVGTNVPYGKWLEFGTTHIAGGRVKALGTGIDVTDSQAIKVWSAKNAGFVDPTTGVANARAVYAHWIRFEAGSPQEQMPWLRPAFNAIKGWAVEMLKEAMLPPGQQGKGAA